MGKANSIKCFDNPRMQDDILMLFYEKSLILYRGAHQSLKSKSKTRGKGEDGTEIQRCKFDINQWNIVPLTASESKWGDEPEKRLDRIDSLPTD